MRGDSPAPAMAIRAPTAQSGWCGASSQSFRADRMRSRVSSERRASSQRPYAAKRSSGPGPAGAKSAAAASGLESAR